MTVSHKQPATSLLRRDPRQEWILRNRLHPLHEALITAHQPEQRGPSGLVRKNPHTIGFIGPNGIKRIDRLAGNATPSSARHSKAMISETVLPLVEVTNPHFYIAVVPDLPGGYLSAHDKDVLGQAQALVSQISEQQAKTGAVVAIVFGELHATNLDTAGVDRLIHLTDTTYTGFNPESHLAVLCAVDDQLAPHHWLFPDSIHGGFDLGCRLAATLNERPATQVWKADHQQITARISGGKYDYQHATPRIIMLSEECHLPVDEKRHAVAPLSLDIETKLSTSTLADHCITDLGQITVDPNAIPLAEAPFILSGGNGITDWEQFHTLAAALGATEGASRVAVDDGFMPRDRQVGASGTWVTADVYLAVGISGAIQHMQGIGQCRKVIAINTDANCDMVKRADLSLICESQPLFAALLRRLEARVSSDASIPLSTPAPGANSHAA